MSAPARDATSSQPAVRAGRQLELEHVSKHFEVMQGRKHVPLEVLQDVSLTVRPGEFVSVTGMTGCGKTTLLRLLMGVEPASSGRVLVDGREVSSPAGDRAMVFQHAELFPWRSALGNVEFGLEVQGVARAERMDRARAYLGLVGLRDAEERFPHELSGGMRQRVGMARALAIEPGALLMDEPFGAVDAQTRESLQHQLLQIHALSGQTIVFVTHDLDEAVLLADRVVMMSPRPGRVHAVVDVDLDRPRPEPAAVRADSRFVELRTSLWELLKNANALAGGSRV